jgi:hypothetical protein
MERLTLNTARSGVLADEDVLGAEKDDRGRPQFAFGVGQHHRLAGLVHLGDAGKRRAQVDADGAGLLCSL